MRLGYRSKKSGHKQGLYMLIFDVIRTPFLINDFWVVSVTLLQSDVMRSSALKNVTSRKAPLSLEINRGIR